MKYNFKKTKLISILSLSLPLCLLFTAQPSQANDWKTWSGGMCQAYLGAQEVDLRKESRGLINLYKSWRVITCGLPRDNTTNKDGALISVYVAPDPDREQTTVCRVYESTYNGEGFYRSPYVQRDGSGWIHIETPKSPIFGHRVLNCHVPSKGKIVHIRMRENLSTDKNS